MKIAKFTFDRYKTFVFIILSAILTIKNCLFLSIVSSCCSPSVLFANPWSFVVAYLPNILPAMIISSFVFVGKKNYWTIPFVLLADIWAVSNLLYYHSYGYFLEISDFFLVNNMSGTWSSIFSYWHWNYILFTTTSVVYIILFLLLARKRSMNSSASRNWPMFIVILAFCVFSSSYRWTKESLKVEYPNLIRDQKVSLVRFLDPTICLRDFIHIYKDPICRHPQFSWPYITVRRYSIITYFPQAIYKYFYSVHEKRNTPSPRDEIMKEFLGTDMNSLSSSRVIVILVESLESWIFNDTDSALVKIAPNMNRLISNEHSMFFPHVKCQTLKGNSGDGQMLVMTGLLPVRDCAACMVYGRNTYPSLAKCFRRSAIINPWMHVWNQDQMSKQYGFTNIVEPIDYEFEIWPDAEVINQTLRIHPENDFVLSITSDSHSPFFIGENGVIDKDASFPEIFRCYLNAIHHTDSCIGLLTQQIREDSLLQNSTIIITGDHIIFNDIFMKDYAKEIPEKKLPIPASQHFVPLIIYNPILDRRTIYDTVYQMDIFSTILSLSGCDYYWKGFGVDLTNDSSRINRKIQEEDAFNVSNQIILTDYFKGKIF